MSLLEIIENSDDSKLLDLSCGQDEIMLTIAHGNFDKTIRITFPFQNFFSSFSSKSDGICFLSIENIKDTLNVKNGVYIPSADFGDFMYDVREGNSIGYGLRESKFKFFLSYRKF
ncbi:hypothetical protein [Acinetobacter sp. PK01]|uniref:hypothetical protein n=1 Tax=Acinetobacter sp. PK01 TaxID=2930198 RepID=UPI001FB62D4B|nr:hypothetical protein [Acinetobacter sp. PK01]UOG18836.1 hypothetical protein MP622_04290 [Acinetobacter sp. PK01]